MAEGNDKTEMIGLIEDRELDGLLEDALLDYDTPSKPIPKLEQPQPTPVIPQIDQKEIAELSSMMQGLLGQDVMKEFEMFSKELEQNMPDMWNFQGLEGDIFGPGSHKPIPSPDKHFSTEDTIQDLNKNLENAKAVQPPGIEEGGEQMLEMVQELMGDLLSRDVLYEPMKELCAQYPKYLAEEEISSEDKNRFSRQLIVMEEICKEYDSESDKDTQQVRVIRQNRILKLVQELQELGNPPSGLIDAPGLPNLSQMSQVDNSLCNQQ